MRPGYLRDPDRASAGELRLGPRCFRASIWRLAVPGMPAGSPGMALPDTPIQGFQVFAFDRSGKRWGLRHPLSGAACQGSHPLPVYAVYTQPGALPDHRVPAAP